MNFDYVIVGGGSAGCVVASRLSEDPSVTVCLIEAGPRDTSPLIHMPGGISAILPTRHVNWAFKTVPQPGLGGRRGYQPRGKALGGSSSINSMVYIRGHKTDYDDWANLGNGGWSYEDVLPWFKKSEDFFGGESRFHGTGGELAVTAVVPHPATQAFVEGAHSVGHRMNVDFNGEDQEGVGLFHVTMRNGRRCSTSVAFIHPVANKRTNLTVITNAQVTQLLMSGKTALGVRALINGRKEDIRANRETILSAGAFGSPQLLLLSGIGSEKNLRPHGIDVRHELPGVGEGLVDHPDYALPYTTKDKSLLGISFSGAVTMFRAWREYQRSQTGILASNCVEAGGFLRTDKTLDRPDVQLHYVIGIVDDHNRKPHFAHGMSCHVCVLRPKSRGSVTLNSADPLDAPRIDPGFFTQDDDVATMLKGYYMVRDIMESGPLGKYAPKELYTKNVRSEDEFVALLRRRTDSVYHPVGTCRMGNDELSVVDQRLRVRGVERLRVIDASIMPTLVGGNTNAPSIMIGERGAAFISEDWGLSTLDGFRVDTSNATTSYV
ncbi:GMC family oxidoreductase N-terminal domain-containing protein [Paraburkholderia caribensis]|uniref:GMC family oxidoreductase n=1 Tax=Paraburkholderia TaxID=1822464 RepID=UPI001CAEC647|nr:GMC family oxidoreductase N-terminal domain-containing protein [Paraburkholderia caribensis]BEU25588.1 GMC family oxidoreductase N-terminal domain-containing protein [Paraburkholderia sp. 22B1P]CAG9262578.1 Alcohol dehydrogenase (acceptor) [Paraburkholderia caribensis]